MADGDTSERAAYLAIAASVAAAFGGLLFGYDIGIISGALLQLKTEFKLTCFLQEMLVSSLLFGSCFSSLFGGFVVDRIGRKVTMILNCLVFMVGALLLSLSSTVAFLIVGRVLLGSAVGLSIVAECAYISEIAPASHRGKLISLTEIAIAMGFMMAYLVNYLCINMVNGWRIMFGVSGVFALIQCVALLFMPKSPRFLLIKNNQDEAADVLHRLRASQAVAAKELSALKANLQIEKRFGWRSLFSVHNNMLYRLLLGCGLVIFQQCSGQPSVLYYAPTMLEQLGFESNQSATLASVGAGVTKVVGVVASLILIDRVGRKKLLVSGAVGMALALFTLAGVNNKYHPSQSELCIDDQGTRKDNSTFTTLTYGTDLFSVPGYSKWLSLISMLVYTASYSVGFGPVTWVLLSEIYPSAVKGRAIALVSFLNWLANLLISFTFLDYMDRVGVPLTFITYGVTCCLAIIYILMLIPETRGKTLEEMNIYLNDMSLVTGIKTFCKAGNCCENRGDAGFYEPLADNIVLEPLQSSVGQHEF